MNVMYNKTSCCEWPSCAAEDRSHRLGQTKPVTIYRLVTKGTVDERIVAIAERKVGRCKLAPSNPR